MSYNYTIDYYSNYIAPTNFHHFDHQIYGIIQWIHGSPIPPQKILRPRSQSLRLRSCSLDSLITSRGFLSTPRVFRRLEVSNKLLLQHEQALGWQALAYSETDWVKCGWNYPLGWPPDVWAKLLVLEPFALFRASSRSCKCSKTGFPSGLDLLVLVA